MPTRAANPLDDEIRALYQGPLGDFTPGRQALAKRLQKAADPRAGEAKELRKPTPSAWAVNRLFGTEASALAALLAAGARARAGQAKAMTAGDGAAVREALEFARAEAGRLTERAAALFAESQGTPSAAVLERIRIDLDALALDPANAAQAERGWLDVDLEPPGFEVLAALQVAAEQGRGGERGPTTADRRPAAVPTGVSPSKNPQPSQQPAPQRTAAAPDAAAKRAAAEREQRIAAAAQEVARVEAHERGLREAAEAAAATASDATRAANEAVERAEQARRAAVEAKRLAEVARFELLRAREAWRRAGGA